MKGSWILIWIFIIAGISLALFQVEQKVQQREEELAQLNQQILKDQEALHVLKAEWSYLNQPSRLEGLNDKFLSLAPVTGWQIAKIGDLPFRSPAEAVQDNLNTASSEPTAESDVADAGEHLFTPPPPLKSALQPASFALGKE